jgi:hypothetical protein
LVGSSGDDNPRDHDSRVPESAPGADDQSTALSPTPPAAKPPVSGKRRPTAAEKRAEAAKQVEAEVAKQLAAARPKPSWWADRRARKAAERERLRAARELAETRKFELQKDLIDKGSVSRESANLIAELNNGTTRNRFLLTYVGPGAILILSLLMIMFAAWWAKTQELDQKAVLGALGLAITGTLGGVGWSLFKQRGSSSSAGPEETTKSEPDTGGKGPPEPQ